MQFSGLDGSGCEVESKETWIWRYIDKARPMTSKPGPILAEEQGTSGRESQYGRARWTGQVKHTYDVHLDNVVWSSSETV